MFTEFLNTCLKFLLKLKLEPSSREERALFSDFVLRNSTEPGFLKKETSELEYAALCAAACLLDYSQALSIYNYVRFIKVKVSQLGHHFEIPSWLLCHMQISAWIKPTFYSKAAWVIKVLKISLSSNPRDHLLGYLLVSTQRESEKANSTLLKLTGCLWERLFLKMYPQGLSGVFETILGPNHPLSKQWPKDNK